MQRVCFDEVDGVDGVGDNRSADQRELCITPCNSRLRFTSQDRYSATPAATDAFIWDRELEPIRRRHDGMKGEAKNPLNPG